MTLIILCLLAELSRRKGAFVTFVVVDPSEMLLEAGEALRCTTEALRLFAVAAGYGQACSLYT